MPICLSNKFTTDAVKEFVGWYYLITRLLFILILFNFFYLYFKFKFKYNNIDILCFVALLLVDNLMGETSTINEVSYFVFLPNIFIFKWLVSIRVVKNKLVMVVVTGFILSSMLALLNCSVLIHALILFSLLVCIYNTGINFLSNRNSLFLGFLYFIISMFLIFTNIQYYLYNYSQNWIKSINLINYSILYLFTYSSLLVFVFFYVRRLFFK
jgi:hypothetical protein